ncbi:MAG: PqqD family peptide modification chaperone [Lachnospiraceae bacterium]|nr:PqqD family peptide modification chaperone [Lachnospiraceae bacterium]
MEMGNNILGSKYKFDDFIYERVSEEAVVAYRKKSAYWMCLNNSGYRIYKMISDGLAEDDIVNQLTDFYEIPREHIENDYKQMKEELQYRLNECEEFEKKEKQEKSLRELEKSATLHITNRCNLNCPYCYKDANSNAKELSKEDIFRIIDELVRLGFKEFIFSGGEPTIRLDLFEILETVHEKYPDCRYNLITNGTTDLDEAQIDIMVKTLSNIQISIDSYDERVNQKTRGSGSLAKVVELSKKLAAREFKKFYFACVPYTSRMGELANIDSVPRLLRLAAYSGAKGLYVNALKPNGRMSLDEYRKYDIKEFWKCIDDCEQEMINLYNIGYRDLSLYAAGDFKHILVDRKHRDGCSAGVVEIAVDNDGNVYPCPALMIPEYLFGNVYSDSMEDIYKSMSDVFEKINVDNMAKCKDCTARYICGGGCRSVAYMMNNDIMSIDPHCEEGKKRLKMWQAISLRVRPLG